MLRKMLTILAAGVILAASAAPAFAQQYPNVSNLKPFSAEANFMSLAGYLRWLVFQQAGQWISYAEASRVLRQQQGQ